MARLFIALYILFAPFTTWLGVSGWLRFPLQLLLLALVSSAVFLVKAFVKKPLKLVSANEDWYLLAILPIAVVSFLYGTQTGRSFNHLLALFFVFLAYVVLAKAIVLKSGITVHEVIGLIAKGTWLIIGIVIVEWALLNGANTVIRDYFLLSDKTSNMGYYDEFFFKTVAGVCEEPSLMAFNLNVFFPVAYYYYDIRDQKLSKLLLTGGYIFALICTASAGGITFALLAYGISRLLMTSVRQYVIYFSSAVALALVLYLTYSSLPVDVQLKFNALYDIIYDKVTLQNMSSMMRVKAWRSAILDFQSSPWIGVGPAYSNEFYSGFGYQNAYFKLMGETGIFSLLFFLIFFAVIYLKIFRLDEKAKPLFFMAISAGLFHWFIADTYYHFTLWVVVILIQLMFIEYRMGKEQEAEQS